MSAADAIAAVQARVASIESRFGVPSTAAARTGSGSFADALQNQLGSTSGIDSLGASAPGATGDGQGAQAVQVALRYLGVPYQWGGTDPAKGLDCSGLAQTVYKQLGVELPRVAADQAKVGTPVASLAEAKPGDLVFFGSPVDHVGIYAGGGRMVVAPHTGDVVKVQQVTDTPVAIRRVTAPVASGVTAPADLAGLFKQAGARYGVSPDLLAAVAKVESGFNTRAVSGAGAQGLMQLMPATARGLGVDPLDPAQAVDGAARLLAGNLQEFGSVDLALAAYNAGGGAVSRYGGIPPFPETQAYVTKVKALIGAAA